MTNNTPTPAQALCEVIEAVWIADRPWACTVDNYDKACHAALTLIRNHGQHFAGLEAENARLEQHIADAMGEVSALQVEQDRLRGSVDGWKLRCDQWQDPGQDHGGDGGGGSRTARKFRRR